MHIHILGISGTFMGGLALLAIAAGHQVTGCDVGVYPPMSTQLEEQGIAIIEGFDRSQVELAPDCFVIGNAISRGNPLMEAILDQGLPYTSGPQWLSEFILPNKWVLAVAGTHGKTTTSAMLTWLLEQAGLAPSYLIGGVPMNFGISARLTDSNFFVIEADEYDSAFFDKRSKFVHYRPKTLILNNLEFDHADIFPDLAAIERQFHHLVRTVPSQGRLIVNADSSALQRVLEMGCWSEVEYFNHPTHWYAEPIEQHATHFSVFHQQKRVAQVHWDIQGQHNRANALAALAAARHVGVSVVSGAQALTTFRNVKRRMEVRGVVHGVTVYDDFAHHPTAISATIDGLRRKIGTKNRILAVLEPRSNTMKMGTMKMQLPESLQQADLVFAFSEPMGKQVLNWDLSETLAPLGERAFVFHDLTQLVEQVIDQAQQGDHILIMSNGSFGGVHEKILDRLSV